MPVMNDAVQMDDLLQVIDRLSLEQKRVIRQHLDEELPLELLDETSEDDLSPRVAGLHAGLIWTSDDFDDPLPDEFWFGEDV